MKKTILTMLLSGILMTSTTANANILNPLDHKAMYFGGLSVITLSGLYIYFLHHPEKLDNYISKKPKEALLLLAYVEWRINTTKSDVKRQEFTDFKNYLDLGIMEWKSQEIEKDPSWIKIHDEVLEKMKEEDEELDEKKKTPVCKISDLQKLMVKYRDFNIQTNPLLPSIKTTNITILDVNSYYNLTKEYEKLTNKNIALQQDHVPSFAAIEKFLEGHNIKTKTTIKISANGKPYKVRDSDLENNESAIAIPESVHRDGSRTFGGRNTSKKIKKDSEDLRIATGKDIATIAYFLNKDPNYNLSYKDYIKSSMTLYLRNKMLCLYDL